MSNARQKLMNEIARFCDESGILDPRDGVAAFSSMYIPGNFCDSPGSKTKTFQNVLSEICKEIRQNPEYFEGAYSKHMQERWNDQGLTTYPYVDIAIESLQYKRVQIGLAKDQPIYLEITKAQEYIAKKESERKTSWATIIAHIRHVFTNYEILILEFPEMYSEIKETINKAIAERYF